MQENNEDATEFFRLGSNSPGWSSDKNATVPIFKSQNRLKLFFYEVNLTEYIKPSHLRTKDERFRAVRPKRLRSLIDKGLGKSFVNQKCRKAPAFSAEDLYLQLRIKGKTRSSESFVCRTTVPRQPENVSVCLAWGRFIMHDRPLRSIVHDNATPRRHPTCILMWLTGICSFRLFSTDITEAYLHSAEELMKHA